MKDQANRVWTENRYSGDATFGGKNFFELIAELNKTPAELKRTKCSPTELGMKLYKGTTKIIKKVDGKIHNVELKFPELLVDDERIWRNRKPVLLGDVDALLPHGEEGVECECDECLLDAKEKALLEEPKKEETKEETKKVFQTVGSEGPLEKKTRRKLPAKPRKRTLKLKKNELPTEELKGKKREVLNQFQSVFPAYAEYKMNKQELENMEKQDVWVPSIEAEKPLSSKEKQLSSKETVVVNKQVSSERTDVINKQLIKTAPKNKTMKRMPVSKTLIKQYLESGVPVLDTFTEAQLSEMLLKANKEYHSTKTPIMSDPQYDVLRNYIEDKYPTADALQQVGAPIKGTKGKVTLPFNMPSMDKIKPETTMLTSWLLKYPGPYVISCKLDGVSGMYAMDEAGPHLYTRGDGAIGQDISHLIKPLNLPTIPVGTVVRGEFIVPKTTFDAKYKEKFSNPRNFVAGLVNSKTVTSSIKDLDFVVYEMIQPALSPSKQMAELAKHGFDVVQHDIMPGLSKDPSDPSVSTKLSKGPTDPTVPKGLSKDLLTQTLMSWRALNKYEIDGIIVSDDHVYPRTAKNPDHAFAFKMAISDQIAETTVVDVIWEASQDGYLKPRVKIAPISIGGVNIEYTTGFNGKFIEDNKIGPGAKIQMIRSGDVIPYIKSVLEPAAEGKMPDADAMPYEWNATHVDVVLKNVGDNDTVKEKNIVGFFSDLEVEGLATGNVRRIMAAGFDTVPKILKMTEADFKDVDGFKKKMVDKVRTSMQEKVGAASMVQLMAASNKFGRGVGIRVLTPLMDANPDFLTKEETKAEKIAKLNAAGIHKNAEAFYNNIEPFNAFLRECGLDSVKEPKSEVKDTMDSSNPLFEKSIVMTKIRDKEIIAHLKKVGATLEDSFKKNTVALVMKDKTDITNKMRDAEKKGIEIFTVEEFKAKYMM
jgi:NAD-dependent DNA ligase